MKIAIDSDFWDFYDHAFSPRYCADVTWERKTKTSMSKRDQFRLFEASGLKVPLHGTVSQVYERLKKEYSLKDSHKTTFENLFSLVVYLDEYAHGGLGKIHLPLKLAVERYPQKYCSEYVSTPYSSNAVTYRYLQIREKVFWLKYTGCDSWMSNHARKVYVEYLCPGRQTLGLEVEFPMFAVDFIPAHVLYAIDFNTAPGLRDTGLPLTPGQIYDLIKNWFIEQESRKQEKQKCIGAD